MTKPTGAICNLDCKYCFYLEKEKLYRGTTNWSMTDEVLESYIRQYIESQKTEEVTFTWQGGEPTLLGLDYFKKVISFENKYANGKKILNAFQTNGILLDDEWCEFFSANKFLIGISIDGPEEIHNKYRVFKGNQPSFKKVMRAIDRLKKHNVEFNTLTCVQKDNSHKALEVYNFLKEIGSGFMQFIPIVERKAKSGNENSLTLVSPDYTGDAEVTEWSVEPLQYGKFLSEIFDEWVKKDVGKIFVQIFDVALEVWYSGKASLCVFNDVCGNAMALEHNGDLYSCDHYVYPENKLGNIITDGLKEIVTSAKQMKFGLDKKLNLPKYCRECEYLFMCNGECPKHRFIKTPDGEDGLNYLCTGYKYFFEHIDPYMQFMVNELNHQRPPANVMRFAQNGSCK
jgi:uncharacterized protein